MSPNVRRVLGGVFAVVLSTACHEKGAPAPTATATKAPTAVSTAPAPLGYLDESGERPSSPPPGGGTLDRRLTGDPATLNAVMQSGLPEQEVLQYVSRNLLDFDARMRLVPGLAKAWSVSADGRSYAFEIRPDAVWEDGSPVTAADAVFTIRSIVDPKIPSPVFKSVFDGFESVEGTGEKSFVVRFREPYAYRAMSFVLPLLPSKRFAGKRFQSARDNRAPFANGPYRFVSWKPQREIVLERNPRSWSGTDAAGGAAPAGFAWFDRIVFRILPEDPVAYRSLVAGDLDATRLDSTAKAKVPADRDFAACCRLVEYYDLGWNYVALNNRSPLFSDARVRRALTMLLDRASIVRNLFQGSARILSGPWAPDSPVYDATVAPLPFDPPAAKALLDAAGWKDTDGDGVRDRDGRPLSFELLVSAGTTLGRQIDETFAAELASAGVRARIRSLEWAAFTERIDAGDFEAASLAWSASDPNPDPFPFWHSSQVPPAGLNSEFYSNPEADRLMEQARRESDESKRLDIYHRLHRIFRDDAPVVFVATASQKLGFARRLHGIVTSPLGPYGIWPGPLRWFTSTGPPGTPAPVPAGR